MLAGRQTDRHTLITILPSPTESGITNAQLQGGLQDLHIGEPLNRTTGWLQEACRKNGLVAHHAAAAAARRN